MANLIGQTLLSQYRVDEFIASGGMGAVYKVWDLKRNTPLAMKVLHADFVDDPSSFKYFQREARALQKLRHPNVVPFYGLFQEGQTAFILEHYIDGPSLREILSSHKAGLPIPEALAYMQALCSALGYAHSSGVVHCDVKPGNVMVDRGGQVYLADFGIARHAESSSTTIAGAGTPAYMAPEQIRAQPVVPATDIYSLGVLLFELLTGQKPFRGDESVSQGRGDTSGERIRYAHLHLAPPDPRSINPSIPPALAQIVLKCMAKMPENRYAFTGELLAALATLGVDPAPRVQVPQEKNPPPLPQPLPPKTRVPKNLQNSQTSQKNILPVLVTIIVAFGIITVALVMLLFSDTLLSPTPTQPEYIVTQPPVVQPLISDIPPYVEPTYTSVPQDNAAPPIIVSSDTPLPIIPTEIPPSSTPVVPIASTHYDLAFVSDKGNSAGYLSPYMVNSNNLNDYRQLANPAGYGRAQWPSFCGNGLAIEAYNATSQKQWIYLYDQNGQASPWEKNKSADGLGVPRCSPNGQYMAYSIQKNGWSFAIADINSRQIVYSPDVSNYGNIPGYASWNQSSSFLFEVVGSKSKETYLFVEGFPSSPSLNHMQNLSDQGVHAALSPDGSRAAMSCDLGKLCVFDFATGSMQKLLQTQYDVKVTDWVEKVTPVWSTDGQWIYFASVDGGDWDIFRIRPDGSDMKNLTADWTSNEIMPATR